MLELLLSFVSDSELQDLMEKVANKASLINSRASKEEDEEIALMLRDDAKEFIRLHNSLDYERTSRME